MPALHDLTGGDIRVHIRRIAAPAAVGLFCQTLFNMTDAFYAGLVSTAAQSALAFSFPLFFILLSCCVGLGQALTARAANALGSGKPARAAVLVGQGAALAAAMCLLIWAGLVPATKAIVAALGARGEELIFAAQYSQIIYLGAPLFLAVFLLNSGLQATGDTVAFRNSLALAVVLNVFLDPLLMFGGLGLPPLGVPGIAVATLLSQLCGVVYLLSVFSHSILAARWRWIFLRPRPRWLWPLARQSVGPTGRMLCIGLGFFVITGFLGRLDSAAVAAYGIALRVEQLFLLPTIGLEVALLAYAGQNLGAGQPGNTLAAYRLCLRYGLTFMAFSAVILIAGGRWLVGAFNGEAEVLAHGRRYLLVAAFAGPCYLILNAAGAVLMGAGYSFVIAGLSVVRLAVLPSLLFWLLAGVAGMGVNGVWAGVALANIAPAWWLHRRCLRALAERGAPAR